MALTLHMPGTLDLIIKGVLAGGIFSDSVVLCVTSQLNVIIAIMVNMMIFFIGFPGNDSNLLIVFYVQIMPDDFVMQLHRF
ncbi:hypothetical protein ECO25NV_26360 [Escherichia coli O25:H4]|nr:hypothetical protein ECO25NV_26360 [Escherichia coli O25:H4]